MFRRWFAAFLLASLVVGTRPATAAPPIDVHYTLYTGGSTVMVVMILPQGVDRAARQGNAQFDLEIAITYQSSLVPVTDTYEIRLDETQLLGTVDGHTALVRAFFRLRHIYDLETPIAAAVTVISQGH